MLAALSVLRNKKQIVHLHCIHVEHAVRSREESRGDAEFVRSLCGDFNVPCRIVHIKPGRIKETAATRGVGISAAARFYRRRILFKEAQRLEKLYGNDTAVKKVFVLTAHQKDDMLETVLMQILRGAGPSGLAAMPVNRGRLLRPLLELSRCDILGYLREKKIAWREDASNKDNRYFRNNVRNRFVPFLNKEFPRWQKALVSLGETQSLAAKFIKNEVVDRVKWKQKTGNKKQITTDADSFFAQPAIIREEALFYGIDILLKAANIGELNSTIRRKNIRNFSEKKITAVDLSLLYLKHESDNIVISLKSLPVSSFEHGFSLLINAPGFYTLKGIDIEVSENLNDAEPENAFFTLPPFVIRRFLKEDFSGKFLNGSLCEFTVLDAQGPAAFIGSGNLLKRRDNVQFSGCWVVKILCEKVPGGDSVQRSE